MSYFTAAKIGTALAKARVQAGLSQREIAILIEKNERTVQNWERGQSSPDADEIMDWCTACGVSPITVFMEVLHPDLYAVPDQQKQDDEIDRELCAIVQALPPMTKRLLLFVLKGQHGSSAPAVISEIAANLHCPLNNRVSVCGTIIDQYTFAQIRGLDPCPDDPQPPIDDLKIHYKAGRTAAENGALGYIGRRKE
jgi:transcriptional regulator with XRE-family HTH domain